MPRRLIFAICGAIALLGAARPAAARVAINVDLFSQTMHVDSSTGSYDWPISSARTGFRTPHGTFGVQRMEAMHHSRKYHNAPMPHSLFFSGGYAIHGTYETASLGRPASHGCIRIAPENAATLYEMVAAEGGRISITGAAPESDTRYASRREYTRTAIARRTRMQLQEGSPAYDADGTALGYAPRVEPDMSGWLLDPTEQ